MSIPSTPIPPTPLLALWIWYLKVLVSRTQGETMTSALFAQLPQFNGSKFLFSVLLWDTVLTRRQQPKDLVDRLYCWGMSISTWSLCTAGIFKLNLCKKQRRKYSYIWPLICCTLLQLAIPFSSIKMKHVDSKALALWLDLQLFTFHSQCGGATLKSCARYRLRCFMCVCVCTVLLSRRHDSASSIIGTVYPHMWY